MRRDATYLLWKVSFLALTKQQWHNVIMPGKHPNDKEYIRFFVLNQLHQGIACLFRFSIPYHCTFIISYPFICSHIFQYRPIKVGVTTKNKVSHILPVFLHQVGNGLHGTSGPEGRNKPRYCNEYFGQWRSCFVCLMNINTSVISHHRPAETTILKSGYPCKMQGIVIVAIIPEQAIIKFNKSAVRGK